MRQIFQIYLNIIHKHFNPRTHGECDTITDINSISNLLFQSTHSRGVRHKKENSTIIIRNISIHALTGSATTKSQFRKSKSAKFQSTHSRGVRRRRFGFKTINQKDFNPRTHGECDQIECQVFKDEDYFNPRTHGECDKIEFSATSQESEFQSTHSRGVRPNLI